MLGEGKVACLNAWDFPQWKRDVNDDRALVTEFRRILMQADGVITHNGKRFDWKFLQSRLLAHGLKPLPEIPHVDTCALARSNVFFLNNRLKTLASELTETEKMSTGGWDLWKQVAERKPSAMKKMVAYCKQDVRALEEVFLALRPFAKQLPNHRLWSGDADSCPRCGSYSLQPNGVRVTQTQKYQRLNCRDCGTSVKGKVIK